MNPSEHAMRGKSARPLQIWRIVDVRGAAGDEIPTGRRICRNLQVETASTGEGDRGLAVIAATQEGVVHREQLTALGIGRGAVAHRIAAARLHCVLPGVLAVGHDALSERGQLIAALLYAGENCVLSHGSAALVWGLVTLPPSRLAVTVAGRHMRSRPHLAVYRVPALATQEVRIRHGLPITAPARTLLDLAVDRPDDVCGDALAAGRRIQLVTDDEIEDVLARHPHRTGAARLRRLHAAEHGVVMTRSRAERVFRGLVREAGLPAPEVNAIVAGLEVDFLWRPERLIVEVDGYRFHSGRRRWEHDRLRDQRLLAAGYRVLRVTWGQLVSTPVALAVRIGQALTVAAPPAAP